MLHTMMGLLDRNGEVETASAHCDIPCAIYDPAVATIAALSVVRLLDVMHEKAAKAEPGDLAAANAIARSVAKKEEEAERVKHEVRIIWGDYFKAPQFEKHPQTHDLVHRIMLKASACKQGIKRSDGEELVELVNQFAESFWATKDVETERVTCPYPPSLSVVRPKL